jgi:hypothetical protein
MVPETDRTCGALSRILWLLETAPRIPRARMPIGIAVLAACCALLSAAGPAAPDWPRWRGPHGDGVADGPRLPVRWSRTENVRWSVELPGWGTSSPVVYQDRLFVTTEVQQAGRKSLLTLCLRRDTGAELWRHDFGLPAVPRW